MKLILFLLGKFIIEVLRRALSIWTKVDACATLQKNRLSIARCSAGKSSGFASFILHLEFSQHESQILNLCLWNTNECSVNIVGLITEGKTVLSENATTFGLCLHLQDKQLQKEELLVEYIWALLFATLELKRSMSKTRTLHFRFTSLFLLDFYFLLVLFPFCLFD